MWGTRQGRSASSAAATRRARVSGRFAPVTPSASSRRRVKLRASHAAPRAGWSAKAATSSAGTSTVRSASSRVTSIAYSAPGSSPSSARLALVMPIRLHPPIGATRTRTDRPFTASTTGGRLPAPSVATSASVSSNPRFEGKKGHTQSVDRTSADADASAFDALVLPGGVVNADDLRLDEAAVAFTRAFFDAGKPVAVICHGGWILTDADVLRGRTMTSYKSLKTDLTNAGATWVDEEVVVDDGLVSSRTPDDLPAFNAKLVEEIAEGTHAGQKP